MKRLAKIKNLLASVFENKATASAAILGLADGLVIVVALVYGRNPAVFRAALDAGIGEWLGMSAAVYLSGTGKRLLAALTCGTATLLGCVLPAIPFVISTGDVARGVSALIAIGLGALVCKLRAEKGWLAVAETFGVLLASALLCFGVSFL